jgi:hypothetical protein
MTGRLPEAMGVYGGTRRLGEIRLSRYTELNTDQKLLVKRPQGEVLEHHADARADACQLAV